jgi:hypothetical protein
MKRSISGKKKKRKIPPHFVVDPGYDETKTFLGLERK